MQVIEKSQRACRGATGRAVPRATGDSPWQPDDDGTAPAGQEPEDVEPELEDPDHLEIDDPSRGDEAYWDVFIPDEDERDPLPEPGDFWMDESHESRAEGQEPAGQVVVCH